MASSSLSATELLDSLPDAVVGVDGEGRIAFVNRQAETMFGYERSEMVGRPAELLLPERPAATHARHRTDYDANSTTRPMGAGLDLLARRKDGSEFPVEISLSPLQAATGGQVVSVIRDVTQRRELQAERERLLEIAAEAGREAEAALRVRIQAERLKDDLTHMVVHDLKNPVNGIMMLVQLLLRRGSLSDAQRRSLAQIDRTCVEMTRLLQNVLEIAKMESEEVSVAAESIVLADLIDEVASEYGPVATEQKRRLNVTLAANLPAVVGDRDLLKRVLVNLLMNALRHSGCADVRIQASHEPNEQQVAIHVADDGHGIAEADQPRVFEKYKSWRGATADTGLGLPFCKLAVERMQGHIALRSTAGVGTTFIVTLPSASAPPRPAV